MVYYVVGLSGSTEESQPGEAGADDVSGFSGLSGPEVDEILDDAESLIESAHEALNELLSQHSKDLGESSTAPCLTPLCETMVIPLRSQTMANQ